VVARPTAAEILSELECMWKGVGTSLIMDTEIVPDLSDLSSSRPTKRSFSISLSSRRLASDLAETVDSAYEKANFTSLVQPVQRDPSYGMLSRDVRCVRVVCFGC
jgi:hypothetical protein